MQKKSVCKNASYCCARKMKLGGNTLNNEGSQL